ncbi:ABC transporter substrate-binding protein [Pasteurella multocida]|uniref:ABC transporter substrate-binding protein n=1 Tax=Pasteurella multocida TaxID=747 RepID=UPI0009F32104|nr:ABC transporter substrate-binding protein [Pasteurella multocida]ATF74860.1 iron ABC transporter substrate-binding protein [Pasteurella multocida]ATN17262.1 iron ABC transporter substrate-binding protein [Pasteurella multocida]AWB52914.1 iron ABC transporter substrate-binding protein [Pasteurella multocida]MCL7758778.1 ABC transporter substrate-binding protein [Pasteurella multocida]MCL7815107.1 ABC transporter substrate-binding protein [Pasteurella multocida]
MKKTFSSALIALGLSMTIAGVAHANEKLIVYTSMKESLIGALKTKFNEKHPDIAMDYQSAGAGKLMAKIAAEKESGQIMADVIWTSEVPDFFKMKANGMLDAYVSPEVEHIVNPIPDFDGSFTPIRLGTLGIAYNTRFVKEPPTSWDDIAGAKYKGAFGIANPALSGTAYMSVALLKSTFGWEFFEKIKANKGKVGKGSGQVVDDTASGDLLASLAVDYITNDKIKKGAQLKLVYPKEMLVIPSPAAIFKGTKNPAAAKKFIDFLLSEEAQHIIAHEGTLPVRKGVTTLEGMPTVEDAISRAIPIDYQAILTEKEEIVKKFTQILQGRQ